MIFYGVGAQKSGTSWLYTYLRDHPQVFMNEVKELDYWSLVDTPQKYERIQLLSMNAAQHLDPNDGPPIDQRPGRYQRALSCMSLAAAIAGRIPYHALFAARSPEHKVWGEISPSYGLNDTETFRRMDAFDPEARFIYIMRDPVLRYWSSIRMLISRSPEELERAGSIPELFEQRLYDPVSHLRRFTEYDQTLARLEAAVPQERIHTMFYETLFSEKGAQEAADLCSFLGIDYMEPDLGKMVWETDKTRVRPDDLSAEMEAQALEVFAPVYRNLEKRFGDRLPPSWRDRCARLKDAA